MPFVVFLAAAVGLVGGFFANKLDRVPVSKHSEQPLPEVVTKSDVSGFYGTLPLRAKRAASERYFNSSNPLVLIIAALGLIITVVLLAGMPHTALISTGRNEISFSPLDLWNNMGWLARGAVSMLVIMFLWSLAVIIDRALYFSAARKQSREFAPRIAGALKEGKLDEAVRVADRNKKSHLAEVVTAGLQEFRNYGDGGAVTEEQIESSRRALERTEAIVHAKLKRGLGGLATIGSTAPFIGLFGTVVGILNAFQQIATQKTSGIGAVAGGISEALVTTAFGLLVAIPAVMTFNYFTGKVEEFDEEMDDSSSELIEYFNKHRKR
jgi:biopolymer transport protein ExbB/biopolymer transport protein TolQ